MFLQEDQNDINFLDSEFLKVGSHLGFDIEKSLQLQKENSWIDQYLSPEAISRKSESMEHPDQENLKPVQPTVEGSEERYSTQGDLQSMNHKSHRSVFHNVQKNLITFLRKVNILRRQVVGQPGGLRAYDLWKIFLKSRVDTKRCLHMIFGVVDDHKEASLKKVANSLPEFKLILSKNSLEKIQMAQSILRKKVYAEVSNMTKEEIQDMCKMANFEAFYAFLRTFLEELQGEGLSLRMKKNQKQRIFENKDVVFVK